MPQKKSKAKKPAETMRQKQMRLRREAQAAKAKPKSGSTMVNRNKPTMRKLAAKAAQARKRGQGGRPLVRRAELDKAMKPSIKRGASALRGRANAPAISARMEAKLKAARATRGVRGLAGRAGKALAPLGAALEVKSMVDRSKRDAERNRRLGRRPFEELRADNKKGNSKRRGQGGRNATTARGQARKNQPGPNKGPNRVRPTSPYYGPGGSPSGSGSGQAQQRKPKGTKPAATVTPKPKASRPAAKPAPKKTAAPKKAAPAPKKVTKKVSGVGPVKSGRSYSVSKTGKSVLKQQADELRAMRKRSQERQKKKKK